MSTTFGDRLRKLRQEKDLYIEELADTFFISKSALGSYERNEREPSYKNLVAFADYFNVSLDYLMGRSNERMSVDQYIEKDKFELSELLDNYKILVKGYELSDNDKQRLKDVCIALFLHNLDI